MKWWLAVAVVAMCGCASAPSTAPGLTNPCNYVSGRDVAQVIGGYVADGAVTTELAPRPSHGATSCLFRPRSSGPVQFVAVGFVDRWTYNFWHSRPQMVGVQPITGIGDQAFVASGIHFQLLFVARGAYRVVFEVAVGWTSQAGPLNGWPRSSCLASRRLRPRRA